MDQNVVSFYWENWKLQFEKKLNRASFALLSHDYWKIQFNHKNDQKLSYKLNKKILTHEQRKTPKIWGQLKIYIPSAKHIKHDKLAGKKIDGSHQFGQLIRKMSKIRSSKSSKFNSKKIILRENMSRKKFIRSRLILKQNTPIEPSKIIIPLTRHNKI